MNPNTMTRYRKSAATRQIPAAFARANEPLSAQRSNALRRRRRVVISRCGSRTVRGLLHPVFLIQILLPCERTRSSTDPRLDVTWEELLVQFGGATAYFRARACGDAMALSVARDTLVMEVVSAHFDRDWWRTYARALGTRFDQDVVHVRTTAIEMLEADQHGVGG